MAYQRYHRGHRTASRSHKYILYGETGGNREQRRANKSVRVCINTFYTRTRLLWRRRGSRISEFAEKLRHNLATIIIIIIIMICAQSVCGITAQRTNACTSHVSALKFKESARQRCRGCVLDTYAEYLMSERDLRVPRIQTHGRVLPRPGKGGR